MSFRITNLEEDYSVVVSTPEEVYDKVEDIVGMVLVEYNGVPYPIEASCWAELACVGECFEHDKFTLEVL